MTGFGAFPLPEALHASLKNMRFTSPTPIQAEAVPIALEGHDILGSAATGTGKTAAFAIPLVAHLIENRESLALVLAPTRELAGQVAQVIRQLLGEKSPIRSVLLIGGDSMEKQLHQLRSRPRVIIGTPGRINDHLARGTLKLQQADFLVLDETDRMLDMGFGVQLERIVKHLPKERQTLMFSATLPAEIVRMAEKYLCDPVRIAVDVANAPAKAIQQEIIHTTEANKYTDLLKQLETRDGSVIIFVKTKFATERLAKRLCEASHEATAIHGDLRQNKRDRVIHAFRQKRYRIMVATDIAARGLDIPHIEHVINFDLPQCPEDYIHRIGRTARGGASGSAVSLIAPADGKRWREIAKLMNPNAGGKDKTPINNNDRPNRKPYSKKPFEGDKFRRDEQGASAGYARPRKPFSDGQPRRRDEDGSEGGSRPRRSFEGDKARREEQGAAEYARPRKPFSGGRPRRDEDGGNNGGPSRPKKPFEGDKTRRGEQGGKPTFAKSGKPFSGDKPKHRGERSDANPSSTPKPFHAKKRPFGDKRRTAA